ncbi:transposase [Streptomyces sp. NPDC057617]|uniref:transposase n=1 Tax=Streptomyces sp. NPDC057617 TaxID=3346184 RepID=UPI003676B03D
MIAVPLTSQGIDPAKKIIGRKRHIVTETLGLLLAVTVTAAGIHDSAAATQLLPRRRTPPDRHQSPGRQRLQDQSRRTRRPSRHRPRNRPAQPRNPATPGFHVQPRRWVIEPTLGWLMHHSRLARDYETHPTAQPQ